MTMKAIFRTIDGGLFEREISGPGNIVDAYYDDGTNHDTPTTFVTRSYKLLGTVPHPFINSENVAIFWETTRAKS